MAAAEAPPANLGAPSANKVLRHLKRQEQGLYNCVASVVTDAAFVQEMAALHPELPLVANLRCGAWYVPRPAATCYFKSMDGHAGQWAFSEARLNWHLALLAAARGGCFIVDATRRGKTFPDALTKTIPIWAAVVNQAVARIRQQQQPSAADSAQQHSQGHTSQVCSRDDTAQPGPPPLQVPCTQEVMPPAGMPDPDTASIGCSASDAHSGAGLRHSGADSCSSSDCGGSVATVGKLPVECGAPCARPDATDAAGPAWDTELHLPLWISGSERRQIEARLPGFVQQLLEVGADIGHLATVLRKPLRPLWLSPDSRVWLNHVPALGELPFTPLFLVSASRPRRCRMMLGGSEESEALSFDYVPGAGDDEESWARGLTAPLLWAHSRALLAAGPAGIDALVAVLAADSQQQQQQQRRRRQQQQQQQQLVGQKQHSPGSHVQPRVPRPHAPLPTGCADPAALSALPSGSSHGVVGASVLWRLGGTGIALSELPADGSLPPEIWQHADAVLDLGSRPQQCTSTTLTDGLAAGSVAPCAAVSGGGIAARQRAPALHSHMHRHVQGYKAAKTSLLDALPAVLQYAGGRLEVGQRLLIGSNEGLAVPCAAAVALLLACFGPAATGDPPSQWRLRSDMAAGEADNSAAAIGKCQQQQQQQRQDNAPSTGGTAGAQEAAGQQPGTPLAAQVSKADVRRCLAFVSGCCPSAQPTQGLLKQVFLHFEIASGHHRRDWTNKHVS